MKKRAESKKQSKPQVLVPVSIFHGLSVYMLTDYRNRVFLAKLRLFFNLVDTSLYKEDGEIEAYYNFISTVMEVSLDNNIDDTDVIFSKILDVHKDREEFNDLIDTRLIDDTATFSPSDSVFFENEIIQRLNFYAVSSDVTNMKKIISRYESGEYVSYASIISDLSVASKNITKKIMSKSITALDIPDVYSGSDAFRSILNNVIVRMNDSKRIIRTGIRRLNTMINGGFEPGRLYIFCGVSGGWKSGWLFNCILHSQKFNDDVVMLDPNKKPCALYISGENDTEETLQREISYVAAYDDKRKALPVDETLGIMREEKLVDGPWEKVILYRPKNSISTGDLEGIINEIEAGGELEVKILVYDYLKRIKPDEPTGDIRLDIGEATNDLSILAKKRKIPVVTANQLNRAAYAVLQEVSDARKGNDKQTKARVDMGKSLDQTMISESNMMLENADFVCAINKEYSRGDGNTYLTFKDLKNRSDKGNNKITDSYFAHPFVKGNSMRLQEDVELERSLSFDHIADTLGSVVDDDEVIPEDRPTTNKPKIASKKKSGKVERIGLADLIDDDD